MLAVSIVYFGFFAALGAFWPYFGPLLVSYGLGEAEATQVIAIVPLFGLLSPPIVGLIADVLRARTTLVRVLPLLALAGFAGLLAGEHSRLLVVASVVVFAAGRSPMTALVDASALAVARDRNASYGRMRLWGSLGFLLAAMLSGELAARTGVRSVVPQAIGLMAITAVAAWFIPAAETARGPVVSAWLERLRHPSMWLFVGATALASIASGIYDAGFSLHLQHLGLGGRFIGAAWSVGVGAEVALMGFSGRLLSRFDARKLYVFALGVAATRWLLLSFVTAGPVILVLQPLHAITFGLVWVTGVTVAHDHGSPSAPTAAQGLFGAAIALGSFTGMSLSGRLMDRFGGHGMFLVGAGCAALAAAAASAFVAVSSRQRLG